AAHRVEPTATHQRLHLRGGVAAIDQRLREVGQGAYAVDARRIGLPAERGQGSEDVGAARAPVRDGRWRDDVRLLLVRLDVVHADADVLDPDQLHEVVEVREQVVQRRRR